MRTRKLTVRITKYITEFFSTALDAICENYTFWLMLWVIITTLKTNLKWKGSWEVLWSGTVLKSGPTLAAQSTVQSNKYFPEGDSTLSTGNNLCTK